MEALEWNGIEYTFEELSDSVVDGHCGKCGETSYGHEPDARGNDCPLCGSTGCVSSIPFLLGVI